MLDLLLRHIDPVSMLKWITSLPTPEAEYRQIIAERADAKEKLAAATTLLQDPNPKPP